MRKLLLFLLLLGAGLFLLYWLDRRGSAPRVNVPVPAPTPPVRPREDAQGMEFGGPSKLALYDERTKHALLSLESKDSRTEGDVDHLTGVLLELFDPEVEDVIQTRITAERARVRRLDTPGELQPRWEYRIELEGVQAQVLAGVPIAPLSFQAPTAVVDATNPKARRVLTEEEFTARSPELSIDGRGLYCELDQALIEIHQRGRVELRRESPTPATFSTTGDGPMQVRREPGPGGPVTLEAWQGALLELGGANPGRLVAQHVSLRASSTGAGQTGQLGIQRLDADGGVDWNSGDSVFQGERASATFAPGGRLDHARLDGLPRAQLTLELSPGVLPDVTKEERRDVLVSGSDSLDIDWQEDGFKLLVNGQSSVETREFRLRSLTGLEGFLSQDQRSARFAASGGVVVESGNATLQTVAFEVAIHSDASGETLLEGTASGGPLLTGTLPPKEAGQPGRGFTLTSPDSLKIERSTLGWRVVEGTRVEVTLDDPDGFQARADRVRDFDVASFGFVAEGGIVVSSAAGRFGGERLEVFSADPVLHFLLTGTPEKKAFYIGEYGEATALEVEVTGASLRARGAVAASIELAEKGSTEKARYEFKADEVTFERSESPELLPGERLRTLRLTAAGHVEGGAHSADQTLIVHCARLSFERRERRLREAEPVELGSLLIAEGEVRADVLGKAEELGLDCDRLEVERAQSDLASGFRQLVASGNVRFQGHRGLDISGDGEVLVLDADRRGSLEANPYERVTLFGREPSHGLPFRMTADRVDFEVSERGGEHVQALRPELRMAGLRARAEHLLFDAQSGVELTGAVRASGQSKSLVPFTLDADQVVLVGRRPIAAADESSPTGETAAQLDAMRATGGVDFRLGDGLRARGERLTTKLSGTDPPRMTGVLRLDGAPASFETAYARLETEWVEFDPTLQMLVGTGRGRVYSLDPARAAAPSQEQTPSWTLDFLSSSTLFELDSIVFAVQEPVFHTGQFQTALRASWGVFWLNREGFQDPAKRDELLAGLQQSMNRLSALPKDAGLNAAMNLFRSGELSGLLREVYLEGPVEILTQGELLARAEAIYLDLASRHGWLVRATLNLAGSFIGQRNERLIVKANWLRLSDEPSLRADQATVTSCTFDDPHVRVVTGNLRITPLEGKGKEHYQLLLKDNRVELYHLLKIPLPTIDISTDEELQPLWQTLSLANSARFGTFLSFAFTRPADKIGEVFDGFVRWLGFGSEGASKPATGDAAKRGDSKPRSEVDAHYKVDGSYLGSRGGLLDLGLEIESKDAYWFDLYLGLVYDTGEDRGFIRVPEDERDTLRRWLRSQGYFKNGKNAWSFSYTDQSDAGVQSEFFENRFLRYERAENYVQWRRSSNENFAQASVKVRIDDFRSDVEELPSLSAYRGRSPLLRMGSLSLLHTGDVRADYLRRREGTDPRSPFADPTVYPDGLGEREVLRVDTNQAVELPVPLGAGWKLTPFVSARASAWNEGADPDDSPTRVIAEGGARLGTNFWKRTESGALHQVASFLEYRSELERNDSDGIPVVFDPVDQQLSGNFFRLGSRGRFWAGEDKPLLDVDLVGTYASDRSDGLASGWLPIEAFARLAVSPLGHEFEVFHDGRYDVENNETVYSLVSLGTHLGEEWGLQASHQFGRDANGDALFEAASISGLYRWTEKWEFEGRESFSLLENVGLDSRFVMRRYGHDVVFELETRVREGEGSSFGISVRPRFGYHPPRVGYVPW